MCGIIGLYNNGLGKKKVKRVLAKALENNETRGIESYGVAIYNFGEQKLRRFRSLDKSKVLRYAKKHTQTKAFVLLHNRNSTSAPVYPQLTHPFLNETKDLALIHNGIVSGHKDLFKNLSKRHKFESEFIKGEFIKVNNKTFHDTEEEPDINDSECLLHIYEDRGIGGINQSDGWGGVILIDLREKDENGKVIPKMVFYRDNYVPLSINQFNTFTLLSSEDYSNKSVDILEYHTFVMNEQGIIQVQKKHKREDYFQPKSKAFRPQKHKANYFGTNNYWDRLDSRGEETWYEKYDQVQNRNARCYPEVLRLDNEDFETEEQRERRNPDRYYNIWNDGLTSEERAYEEWKEDTWGFKSKFETRKGQFEREQAAKKRSGVYPNTVSCKFCTKDIFNVDMHGLLCDFSEMWKFQDILEHEEALDFIRQSNQRKISSREVEKQRALKIQAEIDAKNKREEETRRGISELFEIG